MRGYAAQEVNEVESSTLEKLEELKQEYEVEVEQLGTDLAVSRSPSLRSHALDATPRTFGVFKPYRTAWNACFCDAMGRLSCLFCDTVVPVVHYPVK